MTSQETVLLAFHGKKSVKEKYLNRVEIHRKADEIISGKYWENGKGCAVGCTIEGSDHKKYETELGIPEEMAQLEDGLFELLYRVDPKAAKKFPSEFLKAIPVGADLKPVLFRVKARILRQVTVKTNREDVNNSIETVADLNERAGRGEKVSDDEWSAARSAAWSAESAAWSAARSAAIKKVRKILLEELKRSPVGKGAD